MRNGGQRRSAAPLALATVALWGIGGAESAAGRTLEATGEVLRLALPLAAAGISVAKEDYPGLWRLAFSEAAGLGTSLLLQSTVRQQRPDGSGWRSFPSDSTVLAFSAAGYLERRYGWDYGIPAYALAALVAYSRVEAGRHHWHDVVAGAAIGWGFSALFTSPRENLRVSASTGAVQISLLW